MMAGAPILFDLDGVLIDSMKIHQQAFNEVLSDYNIKVSEDYIAGKSTIEILRSLFMDNQHSESQMEELVKHKQEISRIKLALAGESILSKDAYRTISTLAMSHPLMICTSGSRSSVDSFYQMSKLSRFFVGALDKKSVSRGKPDPEIYLKASNILGVRAQDCWVIEDSKAGCTAAYRAGARLIILENKNRPDPQLFPGSTLINQLSEIIEYVK